VAVAGCRVAAEFWPVALVHVAVKFRDDETGEEVEIETERHWEGKGAVCWCWRSDLLLRSTESKKILDDPLKGGEATKKKLQVRS
jgi:hypothetical protein